MVDNNRHRLGVVTYHELDLLLRQSDGRSFSELVHHDPAVAYPAEPLRVVVYRMAETGLTRLPVISRSGELMGLISLEDLLQARTRNLDSERLRERILRLRLLERVSAIRVKKSA